MESHDTDICIYGGNEAGIFAALSAARSRANVTLVSRSDYIYGVLPSLGAWETHYNGVRSPLTQAFRSAVIDHYANTYGADSPQLRTCTALEDNNPMVTFEPSVAESILETWLHAQPSIQILRGQVLVRVMTEDRRVVRAEFASRETGKTCQVEANTFIDATFEGDFAALADVPWRLGRESRFEYGETHAGRVFSRYIPGKFPWEAVVGKLNLIPKWSTLGLMAGSTGEGDDNVQAYCHRLCLTDDPENRLIPELPPEDYDPDRFLGILEDAALGSTHPCPLHHRFMNYTLHGMVANDHLFHSHQLPNRKRSWNATNYTGAGREYAEADDEVRRRIENKHLDHALGILWFLQQDERVPEDIRGLARQWGLARDEFADHGNTPPQLYVREARRIHGLYTLTEHDCTLAPMLERTPIHADSIAITEFPIDSLDCTMERRPGTLNDGQFFLMEYSRPGQIPYRCLLPAGVDNLLVPVAASVTHVAWGTYRQNPTLLHIAESAGIAAARACTLREPAASLDPGDLQRELLRRGILVAFFNDVDMAAEASWLEAVQFWASRGFFPDYNARGDEPVETTVARMWIQAAVDLQHGNGPQATDLARSLRKETRGGASPIRSDQWTQLANEFDIPERPKHPPTRGELCRWLYDMIAREHVPATH